MIVTKSVEAWKKLRLDFRLLHSIFAIIGLDNSLSTYK